MRVALASDGVTRIAQHAANAIILGKYDDSFAFVPGVSERGNIRVTATIYRDPSYQPENNHEIEIILGCKVPGAKNSKWVECLYNMYGGGSSDILILDGAAPNFTNIGGATGLAPPPTDGDVWVAELDRSTDPHRVRWWINGVLACDSRDGSSTKSLITNLGSGAGIASYRVDLGGSPPTRSNAIGFKSFRCETF